MLLTCSSCLQRSLACCMLLVYGARRTIADVIKAMKKLIVSASVATCLVPFATTGLPLPVCLCELPE